MNSEKLRVKDLVTIGVFAVIYFVLMFSIGMMGIIPILFLIWPSALGLVTGTILMLFMAKVQKPWALFIFGMIAPVLMFVMGHSFVLPSLAFVSVILAELVRRQGGFISIKHNMAATALFNTWCCGSLMQMLLVKDRYIELCVLQMGVEYARALENLITFPSMALVYASALVGGLIGAYIGKVLLKKHFEKAGIV